MFVNYRGGENLHISCKASDISFIDSLSVIAMHSSKFLQTFQHDRPEGISLIFLMKYDPEKHGIDNMMSKTKGEVA